MRKEEQLEYKKHAEGLINLLGTDAELKSILWGATRDILLWALRKIIAALDKKKHVKP